MANLAVEEVANYGVSHKGHRCIVLMKSNYLLKKKNKPKHYFFPFRLPSYPSRNNFPIDAAQQPDSPLHLGKSEFSPSEGDPSKKCSGFCLGEVPKQDRACLQLFVSLKQKS